MLDNKATLAVLTWGLTDRYMKAPDGLRALLSGYSPKKLPLDADLKRKLMWGAVAHSFNS